MSAENSSAYVALDAHLYGPGELTRGPWDPAHQHGGPPVALAGREVARAAAALGMTHVARLTANLLRPVPIAPLRLELATDYAGRNVAHFSGRIHDGEREVLRFTAVAQREQALELPAHDWPQAPRPPQELEPIVFPHRAGVVGYHDLVELRVAAGTLTRGPCTTWFRLKHPLVAGEIPGPLERVAVAADSGNGISAVLPFKHYLFVNPDLTINLLRPARGEWICVDARTLLGPAGGGLAEAQLFDAFGLIGRSTQSLTVRPR
jgi:hypothetical protein